MTARREPESVLISPTRAGLADFPWPGEVLGACTALRVGRFLSTRLGRFFVALIAIPIALLDFSNFPGAKALLSRWSPIGQLAYGHRVASLGFAYNAIASDKVRVDWTEEPARVSLVSEGILLSRLTINGREVFVDRRCGAALVRLWN